MTMRWRYQIGRSFYSYRLCWYDLVYIWSDGHDAFSLFISKVRQLAFTVTHRFGKGWTTAAGFFKSWFT
jgi:hypothetical protein